jgi:hypothetical protein
MKRFSFSSSLNDEIGSKINLIFFYLEARFFNVVLNNDFFKITFSLGEINK